MLVEGTGFSLLPPLVAIVLCIVLREAVVALLLGIIVGSFLLYGFHVGSFFRTFDDIILSSFTDTDNATVLIFTVLTGGFTGILGSSPTAKALISHLAFRIQSRVKAFLAIWVTGFLFFVDDYANCLIVGNAYRGLCDRMKISREKLAYLVDTTSAPIASLALVSTWIGIEISLINDSLSATGHTEFSGYGLFISSISYRFYPILALLFCLAVSLLERDFGPMRMVEHQTVRNHQEQDNDTASDLSVDGWSYLILLPMLIFLVASVILLCWHGYINGAEVDRAHPLQTLMNLFSAADPFKCLLWSTLIANASAFLIHLGLLGESFQMIHRIWFDGCRGMFTVCVILTLAWSIGDVCSRLETGAYVASLLEKGFDPSYLPVLTFFFAAVISFSTGTSYGTMSILMPIALPIALNMAGGNVDIIYGTVGSVLGGAIFGDHCSPLSDTTILSSGASGCSVTAHVNTQLPYAILVGLVSLVCLALLPVVHIPAWGFMLGALAILILFVFLFGRKPDMEQAIDPNILEELTPAKQEDIV